MPHDYEVIVKHLGKGVLAQQVNRVIIVPGQDEPILETTICQMINVNDPLVAQVLGEMGYISPHAGLKQALQTVIDARARAGGINPPLHNAIEELKRFI